MSRNTYQPRTSKRQVIGGVNNEPSSRRQIKKERVTKAEKRKIRGPRGEVEVNLNPGDTVTTTTYRDGSVVQSVDYTKSKSSVPQKNTSSQSKTQTVTKTRYNKRQRLKPRSKTKRQYTSQTTFNDSEFINKYIQAYKDNDQSALNNLNVQLAQRPNKNQLWKSIWNGMDSSHTQELSDAQHQMFYTINQGTPNEMGQTNWYNIFDGNLLHATADDLSIPRSSLDFVSPEQRAKIIQITTPNSQFSNEGIRSIDNSNTIDDIINQNSELFKSQYEYAKQHNEAFNYLPSAFDTSNLNVNYKYGGIGDFMDTYGINPKYLYNKLEAIYK